MGGTPKSSKLDHFRIETHGDLGIPHDLRNPHLISLKLGWPNPPGVWLVDLLVPPGAPPLGSLLSQLELALPYGHWMMAPMDPPPKFQCSSIVHWTSIKCPSVPPNFYQRTSSKQSSSCWALRLSRSNEGILKPQLLIFWGQSDIIQFCEAWMFDEFTAIPLQYVILYL